MYIQPNTNLRILKGCPLDTTFDHTIYFENIDSQRNYFMSLTKYTFTQLTYQRVTKGSLRVERSADDLYDCNYLMFQNTSYGNKWFYGFITKVSYVNNITAEIEYQLDPMQTWYFDYQLQECFVEREHVTDDTVGIHTIPEGLETGPYVVTNSTQELIGGLGVYMLATETDGMDEYFEGPGTYGGFPQPCYLAKLGSNLSFAGGVVKVIADKFAEDGKKDAIVAIFTAPWNFVSTQSGVRRNNIACASRTLSYTPKNNKLYVYPYCALEINTTGQAVELQYELFNSAPTVQATGGFGANMDVSIVPLNYAGKSQDFDHVMSLSGFPVLAWIGNYYQNWIAQHKESMVVNTAKNLAGAVARTAMTGGATAPTDLLNVATSTASTMATINEHKIIPDSMNGSANAGDILAVSGDAGVRTYCKAIRPEYAKMIDDYFTMYGYKINMLKVPNIHARAHWTYTKTIACVVTGSVPSDDMKQICKIYDHGITFWVNGNEVGDYTLDNYII